MKLKQEAIVFRGFRVLIVTVAVMGALCGGVQAQDNEAWKMYKVAGVSAVIPVQGRLADSAGVPLDGTFVVTFRFYDSTIGGNLLCEDDDSLTVTNGLFNAKVDYCTSSDINGQALFMSVEVGTDGEMDPRLMISPVPYAYTVRPGAQIVDTISDIALLHIDNDAVGGRALRAYATAETSVNYGVVGASRSPDGFGGYFYNVGAGVALRAFNNNELGGDAIQGESASADAVKGIANDITGRGLVGINYDAGIGIFGYTNSTNSLYPTLYLVQENSTGDFVVGARNPSGTRFWRVDGNGRGFFNGGTQTSGADFAERVDVVGDEGMYEPGDVLVISKELDRTVELSSQPFSTAVMGVYSTEPGVLAGAPDSEFDLDGIPVAITGIVPCKVSRENGPIQRGDLLVTSSFKGHAMRAGANPAAGTVVGKALQSLDERNGVIQIFVSAR